MISCNSFIIILLLILTSFGLAGQKEFFLASKFDNDHRIYQILADDTEWISNGFPFHQKINRSLSVIFDHEDQISYYTNGCYIFDLNDAKIHETSLMDGSNLDQYCSEFGNISSYTSFFIPNTENTHEYLLFQSKAKDEGQEVFKTTELAYYTLDTQSGNLSSPVRFLEKESLSSFDITYRKDGKGYWLAVSDIDALEIDIFEVLGDKVKLAEKIKLPFHSELYQCKRDFHVRFSDSGKKLLFQANGCFFSIFSFDNCIGKIESDETHLFERTNHNYWSRAGFVNDQWLCVSNEKYDETKMQKVKNELYFYKLDSNTSSPSYIVTIPSHFYAGEIFTLSNDHFLVFNKNPDYYYLDITMTKNDMPPYIEYKRSSFMIQPVVSRELKRITESENCISTTSQVQTYNLEIYPNPGYGHFALNQPISNCNITIYDLYGRIIKSYPNYSGIQLPDLYDLEGVHLVRISNNGQKLNQLLKLVILK